MGARKISRNTTCLYDSKTASTTRFERHPAITLLTIVLTIVLILDAATALLHRLVTGYPFHVQPLSRQVSVERTYRNQKTVYHHDLARQFTIEKALWGHRKYFMATDSLGFKNYGPIDVPVHTDKHRILFIGDSFTEGIGVTYRDTFVGHIAKRLAQDNIEVLNAAVASYSPIIYWRKVKYLLEEVGLKFDELIVFLDISDIEDEAKRYRLEDGDRVVWPEHDQRQQGHVKPGNPVKHFVRSHSILLYWALNTFQAVLTPEPRSVIQRRYAALGSKFGINHDRALWTIDPQLIQQVGHRGLEKSAHFMDRLYQLLMSHNIKMTLAVYPWPDQILHNDLDSVQVSFWSAWAASHAVTFLNYFPCFIKPHMSEPERLRVLEEHFIPGDVHWNEAGHSLIAEAFLSFYSFGTTGIHSAVLDPAVFCLSQYLRQFDRVDGMIHQP